MLVERGQGRVGAGQPDHLRIEFDDVDPVHSGVPQHLAYREAVAAAEDQHARVRPGHGRVDEGLVEAQFVAPADPQPAVEVDVEGPAVGTAGEDHFLHPGLQRHADVLAVHRLPRGPFEVVDEDGGGGEDGEDEPVADQQQPPGPGGEVPPEQAEHQRAADDRVDRAGEQRAGQLPEERQQEEGEGEAADEGSDVVGGEQVGHRAARVLASDALDQFHQQRNLGADEQSDGEGEGDQHAARPVGPHPVPVAGPGEHGVQGHRAAPADEREGGLDGAETGRGEPAQPLRGEGADTHREDHHGQHHGRLCDGVAHQVRGERDEFQFVHESAGRTDERAGEDEEPSGAGPDGQSRRAVGAARGAPGRRGTGRGGRVRLDHAATLRHASTAVRHPHVWCRFTEAGQRYLIRFAACRSVGRAAVGRGQLTKTAAGTRTPTFVRVATNCPSCG
ncbi:hypothetical protein QFZ55_004495 [Streptomyces luteogriseus]|nr:hypothetical protein [Streptomyces luteogriseus]